MKRLTLSLLLIASVVLCSCRGLAPRDTSLGQADALPEPAAEFISESAPAAEPPQIQSPLAPVVSAADYGPREPAHRAGSTIRPTAAEEDVAPAEAAALPVERSGRVARVPLSAGPAAEEDCLPQQEGCFVCDPKGYTGPWRPPGISGPWPADEYICDGGDRSPEVVVLPDWSVRGLHLEDTIAHYDTLDGKTEVQQSNRTCIYAPRFAAVRKTYGLSATKGRQKGTAVDIPTGLAGRGGVLIPDGVLAQLQPRGQIGRKTPVTFKDRNRGLTLARERIAAGLHNGFMPYEDFILVKRGQFDASEKARLAVSMDAALTWTTEDSVSVMINGQQVQAQQSIATLEVIEKYERPPGSPRMRVVKLASQKTARPGETIGFTIRFDNIGDQEVGNVTIIDNLTTRLEYVEGSGECSLEANFVAETNEVDSLVLKWEIKDPLEIGQGGVIRFKCRVR